MRISSTYIKNMLDSQGANTLKEIHRFIVLEIILLLVFLATQPYLPACSMEVRRCRVQHLLPCDRLGPWLRILPVQCQTAPCQSITSAHYGSFTPGQKS